MVILFVYFFSMCVRYMIWVGPNHGYIFSIESHNNNKKNDKIMKMQNAK